MIGKLANLVAYKKAPKATYMLKHPVKGTKKMVAAKGLKGLVTGRTGAALGTIAAIPVGIWAARRATRSYRTAPTRSSRTAPGNVTA